MRIIKNGFKNARLGVELDVYVIDGKEWFKAQDISEFLGYQKTTNMTRNIDKSFIYCIENEFRTNQGNKYKSLLLSPQSVCLFINKCRKLNKYIKYSIIKSICEQFKLDEYSISICESILEAEVISKIKEMFGRIVEMKEQAKIGEYRVDLMLGRNFCIEIDEYHHNYKYEFDVDRAKKIAIMMNCDEHNNFLLNNFNLENKNIPNDIEVMYLEENDSYTIYEIIGVYFIRIKNINNLGWVNTVISDIFDYSDSIFLKKVYVKSFSEVNFL